MYFKLQLDKHQDLRITPLVFPYQYQSRCRHVTLRGKNRENRLIEVNVGHIYYFLTDN